MKQHLLSCLACPRDGSPLGEHSDRLLACEHGHRYPVVDGVPVLLRDDTDQTMDLVSRSLDAARRYAESPRDLGDELFLDSLGASDAEKEMAASLARSGSQPVDPVVSVIIAATNGYAYKHLIGQLRDYPIPEIRLGEGHGKALLDIGCNWGRWSIAAARKGYRVVGIDPSLSAVMAAKRTARQLGLEIDYVCGDARFLPFRSKTFDTVFSYSVIQHFSKKDARQTFAQAARVLKDDGECLIQMAHSLGVRSLYHQMRRGFAEGEKFDVRYWTIPELRDAFAGQFSGTAVNVHCYFGLGLEASDAKLVPSHVRVLIGISERLRKWSATIPSLTFLADSVYVSARK